MEPIAIKNAYYVKLGEGGKWADASIRGGMIRIGWRDQTLDDLNNWREKQIRKTEQRSREKRGAPTGKSAIGNEMTALDRIVHSTPEDVWTTFHDGYLWWCRVAKPGIEADATSKYRKCARNCKWRNCDISNRPLIINDLPGQLSMKQRFSATICGFSDEQLAVLQRVLNCEPSPQYQAIEGARETLVKQVEDGLSQLHWKDFELLVDLIFRSAGWRRVSHLGGTMKYADMELEEPISGDRYQVQVKSDATIADFRAYAEEFDGDFFKKLYFVVHDAKENWDKAPSYPKVELILQERLATMVVDFGLVEWLLKKIR